MLQRNHLARIFVFVIISTFLLCACKPVQISTSKIPLQKSSTRANETNSSNFNLRVGTTWVYLDKEYDQAADPTKLQTATYYITETVTSIEDVGENIVARLKQEKKLEKASDNWLKVVPVTNVSVNFVYVIRGDQVFKSIEPIDNKDVKNFPLRLTFDLPLSINKEWCPNTIMLDQVQATPIKDCEYSGKRTVSAKVVSQNPFGNDTNCYQLVDQFTSGPFLWEYCDGVGIVELKYDHKGTKFGHEWKLIDFKR